MCNANPALTTLMVQVLAEVNAVYEMEEQDGRRETEMKQSMIDGKI